jgi:hypothetical protein
MGTQSFAARPSLRCVDLFSIDEDVQMVIADLIESSQVKQKLLRQTKYNRNVKRYVLEYAALLDELHNEIFADIVYGKHPFNFKKLGYNSYYDIKRSKQAALHKQIEILSIMNSEALTPEFEKYFTRIARQIYDPDLSKEDLQLITINLDQIILLYSSM